MKLRSKILLPQVSAMLLLAAFLHIWWEPLQIDDAKQSFIEQADQMIAAGENDMLRHLLQHDLAAVFSAMEAKKILFEGKWHNLSLFDTTGKQLYPIVAKNLSTN